MANFSATLLREKFVVEDAKPPRPEDASLVALSNRVAVPLFGLSEDIQDRLIVRAQNMHVCVRYAAWVAGEFEKRSGVLFEVENIDWEDGFKKITQGYEKDWNKNLWVSVYYKGSLIFKGGDVEPHAFFDVIEKSDAQNNDEYEKSLEIARKNFEEAGKTISISYDSNIAMILNITPNGARCGLIVRGFGRERTFSINARDKGKIKPTAREMLSVAAAYLEGLQLVHVIRNLAARKQAGEFEAKDPEFDQWNAASKRVRQLNAHLKDFDDRLNVGYRPERPDFIDMIDVII